MSRPQTIGLITLCFVLSCRLVSAAAAASASNSTSNSLPPAVFTAPSASQVPGSVGPGDLGNPGVTPSIMALPVQPNTEESQMNAASGPGIDASNLHKFYTFSVELRETYDTNVGTSSHNSQSSAETSLSPSVLVSFPMENTQFSAGYTFGLTYYSATGGTGGNWQYSNSFNANYSHEFSERVRLTAADSIHNSTEPNLFGNTGTPYRDGESITNAFSASGSVQITPLIGSSTTYGNTFVAYLENPGVANAQNNNESTASESLSFTVLPTVSANVGGVLDTTGYESNSRGYMSYSGFGGASWQPTTDVSTSARAGLSYTQTDQNLANGQTQSVGSISPYAGLSASWHIGGSSSLSFDYSHQISPSDSASSNASQSDNITVGFSYEIASRISTHLQLIYNYNQVSGVLLTNQGTSSYTESTYGVDVGAGYNFAKYFSFNFDITESGVSSQLPGDNNYNRAQVGMGVRGTY